MEDTIFALSTPEGVGGIAIIRISGSLAKSALTMLFKPKRGKIINRMLTYGIVHDEIGDIDEVMAVFIPAPHTYTREDIAEIHCHGGEAVKQRILTALGGIKGLRPAAPGEFTKRAYLNGRIDLARAEAVMDIISAESETAAKASFSQLQGSISAKTESIASELVDLIAESEAIIDFPEDDWEYEKTRNITEGLIKTKESVEALANTYKGGRVIKNGIRCAIIGRPNVGKSSILNAAAGYERAIVDEEAGTTRDVLEEKVSIDGTLIRLFDTAGIRDKASGVEKRGIDLGLRALKSADVALIVLESSERITEEDMQAIRESAGMTRIVALNKADLPVVIEKEEIEKLIPDATVVTCSTKTGEGISDVLRAIKETCGTMPEGIAITNARHYNALLKCLEHLTLAINAITSSIPVDIAMIDAREALKFLGQITGSNVDEEIINSIFENFCLGK